MTIVSTWISPVGPCCAQGVRGFGTPTGQLPLRAFGDPSRDDLLRIKFPELVVAITALDRSQAAKQMRGTDLNDNGLVTYSEWSKADVYPNSQFEPTDLDGDGVLTELECTLGWVQKRTSVARSRRTSSTTSRTSNQARPADELEQTLPGGQTITPEIRKQADRLARHLRRVHDRDDSGVVERAEYLNGRSLGDLSGADHDANGLVTEDEIAQWLLELLPAERPSRLAFELQERDIDGDGQVSLAEFAPEHSENRLSEFALIDRNGDGLITPRESTAHEQSQHSPTVYNNDEMMVLLEYGVVVSEIQISDDITIGDVDVRIAMSKREDNFTKMVLLTPNNQAIDLYDGQWSPWKPPIFHNTLIDDEAMPITRPLGTPPLRRAIQPPGVRDEDRASLSDLVGTSTRGRWRLVLRNQNDYEGLLRSWSLVVTPEGAPKVDLPAKREYIFGRLRVTQ